MFINITVKYKRFNIVNVYKILGTILPNLVTNWAIKKPKSDLLRGIPRLERDQDVVILYV